MGIVLDIVGIGGSIFGVAAYAHTRLTEHLKDRVSKKRIIRSLRHPAQLQFYRNALQGSLSFLDRTFGKNWSKESFFASIHLSLGYICFFYLLAWLMGGMPSFEGIVLPQGWNIGYKLLFILAIVAVGTWDLFRVQIDDFLYNRYGKIHVGANVAWLTWMAGLYLWIGYGDRLNTQQTAFMVFFTIGTSLVAYSRPSLTISSTVVASILFILGMKGFITAQIFYTFAVGLGLITAMAGRNVLKGAYFAMVPLVLFTIVNAYAGSGQSMKQLQGSMPFWGSILFLPLINCIFDWISLCISRMLGHHMAHTRNILMIMCYGLLDLGLGIIVMYTLIYALFAFFWFQNALTLGAPSHTYYDISATLRSVAKNPLDANSIWISSMIFTTMIPTLWHFSIVALNFLSAVIPENLRLSYAKRLESSTSLPAHEAGEISWFIVLTWMAGLTLSAIAFYLLLRYPLYAVHDFMPQFDQS